MGYPRKQFLCKKGIRQGDPLTLLIFVLGADLLLSILNEAMDNNLIESPIRASSDFQFVQYVDDTIILLHVCSLHIQQIQNPIMHFSAYIRLRVYYAESIMVPINVNEAKMQELTSILGCSIGASLSHV